MTRVVAVNGSPRKEKGNTAMLLTPFIEGLEEAGAEVELFYASRLNIKPCACGALICWNDTPGECCIQDDMQMLYPKLRAAELLVIATPVYIPLPSKMQILLNRSVSLIDPSLEFRQGRTRARYRKDVNINKIVLVSTSGWWEKGNFETVIRIVAEIAEDASVAFGGAVIRPNAYLMRTDGKITKDGEAVLSAVKEAGRELIAEGRMKEETLEKISRPLITEQEWLERIEKRL